MSGRFTTWVSVGLLCLLAGDTAFSQGTGITPVKVVSGTSTKTGVEAKVTTTTPASNDPGLVCRAAGTTTVAGTMAQGAPNAGGTANAWSMIGGIPAGTANGQPELLMGAQVTTAQPVYTSGQTNALSMTTAGALRTSIIGNVSVPSTSCNMGVPAAVSGAWPFKLVGADLATVATVNSLAGTNYLMVSSQLEQTINDGAGGTMVISGGTDGSTAFPFFMTTASAPGSRGPVVYPSSAYETALFGAMPGNVAMAGFNSTGGTATVAKVLTVPPADNEDGIGVRAIAPRKATYSFSITGLASAAAATDIATITGSGTKLARVLLLGVTGTATAAAAADVQLIKRSTADSGGTSTSPALVPHYSSDAAATVTIKAYTANPTLGTAVGTIRSKKVALPAGGGPATTPTDCSFEFGTRYGGREVYLNGTSEVLAINLNGATITGGSFDIYGEITEE